MTVVKTMVILFLFSFKGYSQHILSGKITERGSLEPLSNVSVLITTPEGNLISYFYTDKDGFYAGELPLDEKELIIKTSIISHQQNQKEIKLKDSSKFEYHVDFILNPLINEIEEVIIKGEKKSIKIQTDTTTYEIEKFKDGNERVVEDILKNLPGITIDQNGGIKFKGKQVIRVLLDNDNIFDDNYSIGTKNIDAEIIESIQAIEDYNVNPLIKGIRTSEDVALNLILKKGKSDFSGSADIGLGNEEKVNLKTTSMLVSKKLKSFSILNYNNVGENYSPFYTASNSIEISKINETQFRASNLIISPYENFILPKGQINQNNNLFGNFNSLFKLNDKTSLRINYSFFKDNTKNSNNNFLSYFSSNESLSISTQEINVKKPTINLLEYELISRINSNSLLTSTGKIERENVSYISSGLVNGVKNLSSSISSDVFLKKHIEYSYRRNSKSLLLLSGNLSSNEIPQELNIESEINAFQQEIRVKRNNLNFESSYLIKNNNQEYSVSVGTIYDKNYFNSDLMGISEYQPIINNLTYESLAPFLKFNYLINKNNWKYAFNLKTDYLKIKLNDSVQNNSFQNNEILINPSVLLGYKTNEVSNLFMTYNFSSRPPGIQNVFSGYVLTNRRTITNNDINFNLFNNHTAAIGYNVNDFYKLFQLNINSRFSYSKYGYLRSFDYGEFLDSYTTLLSVTNNKNLELGFSTEKYIHLLRTTLNFKSSYSVQDYQNIINSITRNNRNQTLEGEFHFRTGFKGIFNVDNKISIRENIFTNEFNSNSLTSFRNELILNLSSKGFLLSVNNFYFNPNISSETTGNFYMNGSISFRSKNKKIEYFLKAHNILNQKTFASISSSDFYNSIFEQNLIQRFLLLSVRFRY